MKKRNSPQNQTALLPNPPAMFSNAMRETLQGIVQAETQKEKPPMKKLLTKRRVLVYAIVAVLLIASVAIAAVLLNSNVFEYTMGTTPLNAASITYHDLADEVIGNVEVKVTEAAYDGMSLFITYSIRDLNATEPMGVYDVQSDMRLLTQDDWEHMASLDVGWWTDGIWIDGQDINMPSMSGGIDVGTETPGEILSSTQYRLDQEDIYLSGKNVKISMPIGKKQPFGSLVIDRENHRIELPDKGIVSFTLDCSARDRITELTPEWETKGERWSAKVRTAVLTPIQTYITVDWAVNEDVMAAYIAENGEGEPDGEGGYYWMYSGEDVVGFEVQSLQLVDKNGVPLTDTSTGFYGNQGIGATVAYFTFPYSETLPDELYMAPTIDGQIDMSYAIRIR